jgi:phenylalanyl-tRNA synthetase beta chain
MLDMLAWNLNRDVPEARLFEMGSIYKISTGERVEPRRMCMGATASSVRASLPIGGALDVSKGEQAAAAEAFRGLKGDVENLLEPFASSLSCDRETASYFHPGRSARAKIDGIEVAQFGQIHPEILAARKLRQDVFVAEIDLEQLYKLGMHRIAFERLAKYPAVERDFSFIFADDVSFIDMKNAVANLDIPELQGVQPAEIFRGGSVPAGKYSMLLRVRLQSTERTLREDELAEWSAKIVAALGALGGVQRA